MMMFCVKELSDIGFSKPCVCSYKYCPAVDFAQKHGYNYTIKAETIVTFFGVQPVTGKQVIKNMKNVCNNYCFWGCLLKSRKK